MVFKFLACVVVVKNKYEVSAGFFENTSNSKSCSESRIKFLFRHSFALIGQFFQVYIHSRLSEQCSGSQAGYGTTFNGTGGYQKAGTSSLKRFTGRNFNISK
jgi:hypothetical protein